MTSKHVFKYKLVIQAVIIIFILSLVGTTFVKRIKNDLSNKSQKNITQVTSYIADNIDLSINNSLDEVELLSNYINMYTDENKEKLNNLIKEKLNDENNLIGEINFANNSGKILYKDISEINISNEEFFKSAIAGNTYISRPIQNKSDRLHYMVYSAPLYKDDAVIGIVFGTNTLEAMAKKMCLNLYTARYEISIMDNKGNIIMIDDEGFISIDLLKEISATESDDKKEKNNKNEPVSNGLEKAYVDKEYRYICYSSIKTREGWYVVTSIPIKAVLYSAKNIDNIITISIMMVISIAVIIHIYISRIKKINQIKLEKIAFEDSLTGINNYNKFLIEAEEFLIKRSMSECAIICFDIDRFKVINDVHGHSTGDEILKQIAENLRDNLGENTIYGRFSNDLFGVILCLDNNEEDLLRIITLIENSITKIDFEDKKINIKSSIGVYFVEDENIDIKRFIDNANLARTRAKSIQNQSYYIFDADLKETNHRLVKIEQDIASGIKNNEFSVYYQAKFNIDGSKMVGAEALIRWNHPNMGMISPGIFIPIAEKNGDINLIGRWVFEQICKDISEWKYKGYSVVPVSMNLSRVELYQSDLKEYLQSNIEKYKIDPSLIEIEITETTALNDVEFINRKINEIKSLGIAIAMDDFGIGNSTLSNLKLVDIDILKIDRSLISDIENDIKSKEMVVTIIELSKKLGLEVVCEGVENLEQVEILKSTNCDVVQGFVFAKPINRLEFENILKNKA